MNDEVLFSSNYIMARHDLIEQIGDVFIATIYGMTFPTLGGMSWKLTWTMLVKHRGGKLPVSSRSFRAKGSQKE